VNAARIIDLLLGLRRRHEMTVIIVGRPLRDLRFSDPIAS
jgi:hypothetical protein